MKSTSTFGELFTEALADEISHGGQIDHIVRLVAIFTGKDPPARQVAFADWLRDARPPCSHCNMPFRPSGTEDIDEQHMALCGWCLTPTTGQELIPGWSRTWRR